MPDTRTTPSVHFDTVRGGGRGSRVSALAVTLGIAVACWLVVTRRMAGMDMGAATALGPFDSFLALWVAMMAAMMLPGAAPAVTRQLRGAGRRWAAPMFVLGYLLVWTLVGGAGYPVYQPHGPAVAGACVIAAGLYELTPLKRRFRARCRGEVRSGFEFGLCCVGSSIGLMVLLLALGVMSPLWMSMVAAVVTAQKLLPAKAVVDVPLAFIIIGLGTAIVLAPSSVPGFVVGM